MRIFSTSQNGLVHPKPVTHFMNALRVPTGGILIAKHDTLLCETLKESLQSRRMYVRGYATDGKEAFKMLINQQPDVLIMGAEMPGMSGLEIARFVYENHLPTRCIIYARSRRPEYFVEALTFDVKGFLFVNSGFAELFYCLQEVIEGREYVTPSAQQFDEDGASLPARPVSLEAIGKLTVREREILCLIAQCFTNNQIAERICRSTATVNNHRHNIMKKLNLQGHHQLLSYALSAQNVLA